VACGTTQVHETSFSEDDYTLSSVWENPTICLRLDGDALHTRIVLKACHVNLIVKVTNVADNGIVFHLPHVTNHDDVLVSSGGAEDIGISNTVFKPQDLIAFHQSLKCTDGIDFSDNDTGTSCLHGTCASLSNITISKDDSHLSSNHHICGPHEPIGQGMAAPVQIVKLEKTTKTFSANCIPCNKQDTPFQQQITTTDREDEKQFQPPESDTILSPTHHI
jgi:hypothetical protein